MASVKDIYSLDAEYYSSYRYEEEVKRGEHNRFLTRILFFTLLVVSIFLLYKYLLNNYETVSKYISVPSFLSQKLESETLQNRNLDLKDMTVTSSSLDTQPFSSSPINTEPESSVVLAPEAPLNSSELIEKEEVVVSLSSPKVREESNVMRTNDELSLEYIKLIEKSLGK